MFDYRILNNTRKQNVGQLGFYTLSNTSYSTKNMWDSLVSGLCPTPYIKKKKHVGQLGF